MQRPDSPVRTQGRGFGLQRGFTGREGFTLIELLVVIAIIAILAAVLFPVFAKARGKARQSVCQSNLKQLYTAFSLYMDSWDDQYPNSWRTEPGPAGAINNGWWDELISPFIKSDGVFACPANDTESYSAQQPFDRRGMKTRLLNYALNNQLLHCPSGAFRFSYTGDPPDPATLGEVQQPAQTILLAEKMRDEANHDPAPPDRRGDQSGEIDVWYHLTGPGVDPATWNPTWGVARALHNKGSNFLLADGHVKYLRLQDTFAPASSSPSKDSGGGAAPPSGPTAGDSDGGAALQGGGIDPTLWTLTK